MAFEEAVGLCSRLGQGRLPRFDSFEEWKDVLEWEEEGRMGSTHLWFPYYKDENGTYVDLYDGSRIGSIYWMAGQPNENITRCVR